MVDLLRQEEVPQERAQEVGVGGDEEMPKKYCYSLHLIMFCNDEINFLLMLYRVTIQLVQNLPLKL